MINLQELRLGNYVNADDSVNFKDVPMRITAITPAFLSGIAHIINLPVSDISVQSIKPIPVAEDILLKCGFWKGDFLGNGDAFCLETSDFYINIFASNTIQGHKWDIHIDDESFMNVGYGHFDYVHELQNLFYDLTKTELKIEL